MILDMFYLLDVVTQINEATPKNQLGDDLEVWTSDAVGAGRDVSDLQIPPDSRHKTNRECLLAAVAARARTIDTNVAPWDRHASRNARRKVGGIDTGTPPRINAIQITVAIAMGTNARACELQLLLESNDQGADWLPPALAPSPPQFCHEAQFIDHGLLHELLLSCIVIQGGRSFQPRSRVSDHIRYRAGSTTPSRTEPMSMVCD